MRSIIPFATRSPHPFARPAIQADSQETCDFCRAALSLQHRHLLEIECRRIICACDACALRFENVIGNRFKLIPRHTRPLPDFRMNDAQWETLARPVNVAFVVQSSLTNRIAALCPGPAGATESPLNPEHWQSIRAENPRLDHLQPDVEALLVHRAGGARDYFLAPIDVCFELAGLIRRNWRGLSGGTAVWLEIETFFARLRHQAAQKRGPEEVYA